MNIIQFGEKYTSPIAVALGFFDCIHNGHRLLVDSACQFAESNGVQSALFTFSTDPSKMLGGEKQIYNFTERASALKDLNLDNLIYADFDDSFIEKSPERFFEELTNTLNVKCIITGPDYRFGKNAVGNVELLKNFCKEKGITLIVNDFKLADGKKISTSSLKKFVKEGDINQLNAYLTQPYFVVGEVLHARNVGRELGFPTANIQISDDKLLLCDGIYATKLFTDGKCYDSMTNVGAKPTFSIDTPSIETFIFDFDGDLYGKEVKLAFYERTRNVTKFDSADELKTQLKKDEIQIRKILWECK